MNKLINSNAENTSGMRINQYLSAAGFCSRREADRLIQKNLVKINGTIAQLGDKAYLEDLVTVNEQIITLIKAENFIYLAFNKPRGIVCTTARHLKNNIIDYINYPSRIFPIGRLDQDSEGLILLTNDGKIVNKILRSRHHHEKEYLVQVNKPLTPSFISNMEKGVPILDQVTRPCKLKQINAKTFSIILTQGLNRQIRRMCEYYHYKVLALKRVRILNIELENLELGKWRHLSPQEIDHLKTII